MYIMLSLLGLLASTSAQPRPQKDQELRQSTEQADPVVTFGPSEPSVTVGRSFRRAVHGCARVAIWRSSGITSAQGVRVPRGAQWETTRTARARRCTSTLASSPGAPLRRSWPAAMHPTLCTLPRKTSGAWCMRTRPTTRPSAPRRQGRPCMRRSQIRLATTLGSGSLPRSR